MTEDVPAFPGPPDTGVIVSRRVWEGAAVLTLVSHDPHGDWQFLDDGDDDAPDRDTDDAVLLHLGHVLERFPEIAALADLPIGWIASRDTEQHPWTREPRPEEWEAWEEE